MEDNFDWKFVMLALFFFLFFFFMGRISDLVCCPYLFYIHFISLSPLLHLHLFLFSNVLSIQMKACVNIHLAQQETHQG